jgi:TRAP-type C4-dicarboxylate transport system permease small subunit
VKSTSLRSACMVLSILAMLAGGAGMVMSFLYLASASMADITAGTSGFVAGSILIGSGLISLTFLTIRTASPEQNDDPTQTW